MLSDYKKICFVFVATITLKIVSCFFLVTPVYAYVDPGSAGMLYQVAILVVGTVVAFVGIFKKNIKFFFTSIFGK